jgi:type II secretory pathway component PulF
MMRSLGSLVSAGSSIDDSFGRVTKRITLIPLRDQFTVHAFDLSHGSTLSSILAKAGSIPSFIVPLISAGEASGTLGNSLIRASDIIDRDIEQDLKRMTALIEPLMMIGMGIGIGTIALSIMMPIYDVSQSLQH